MTFKTGILATLLASATVTATHAADSDFAITGSGGFVSDYRFRGVSQTDKDVALQGNININHKSGFYAGAWGSSIDDRWYAGSELETDLYAGWTGSIGESGVTFDGGLLMYVYPGSTNTNYLEPYASAAYTFGLATMKVGAAYVFKGQSHFDEANEEDSLYTFLDLNVAIKETPLSIQAHAGRENGVYWNKKVDWKLGATYRLMDRVDLSVSYVDTNRTFSNGVHDLGKGGVVFGAIATF